MKVSDDGYVLYDGNDLKAAFGTAEFVTVDDFNEEMKRYEGRPSSERPTFGLIADYVENGFSPYREMKIILCEPIRFGKDISENELQMFMVMIENNQRLDPYDVFETRIFRFNDIRLIKIKSNDLKLRLTLGRPIFLCCGEQNFQIIEKRKK